MSLGSGGSLKQYAVAHLSLENGINIPTARALNEFCEGLERLSGSPDIQRRNRVFDFRYEDSHGRYKIYTVLTHDLRE